MVLQLAVAGGVDSVRPGVCGLRELSLLCQANLEGRFVFQTNLIAFNVKGSVYPSGRACREQFGWEMYWSGVNCDIVIH